MLLLVLLLFSGWLWSYARTPSPLGSNTVVIIPKGSGLRQIKDLLAENGVIRDDLRFFILARFTDKANHLKAGEYLFLPKQTPLQVLRQLEKGDVIHHRVTIPEGMTLKQIADILAKDKWINRDRFLTLTEDRDYIKKTFDLDLESLEGYLFPDTYDLTRDNVSEKKLIIMMVRRFLDIWSKLPHTKTGLNRHEVVTLASIVEKETGRDEERPIIAGVFMNRLKRNMRLQSDPTVIYGLEGFNGNLTRKDLQDDNPYNTYIIRGLPPGPVCNPGRDSILAVLEPADVPYLYFVSRNDGSHHFTKNLKEHNKAVRQYQILHRQAENSAEK